MEEETTLFIAENSTINNATGNGTDLSEGQHFNIISQISLIVIYTLTTLLAVVGNITVIIVFTVGKRSRTDLRAFLINLAISDLVMSLFCMPFTFSTTMLSRWVFSAPLCPLVLYLQLVAVTASVYTNMAIGMDRFWVVMFPLKSRLTKNRSKIVIGIVWTLALGLSSVQLAIGGAVKDPTGHLTCQENWPSEKWRRTYTIIVLALTYLLPLSILTATYSFVAVRLWQRTAPGNADKVRDNHQLRSKQKVIKMLLVVVLLFALCWLPLHTFFMLLDFQPHLTAYPSVLTPIYLTVHWLAMSNSFVNPIIYGVFNDSFRHDLKRLLRAYFPCCRCLPCLRQTSLFQESVLLRDPSRYEHRGSSSGSMRITDHSKKRLITTRINEVGKYESNLTTRDMVLSPESRPYNAHHGNHV